MGWDYYTYVAQPVFFVEAVKDFMLREIKAREKAVKDSKRDAKLSGLKERTHHTRP